MSNTPEDYSQWSDDFDTDANEDSYVSSLSSGVTETEEDFSENFDEELTDIDFSEFDDGASDDDFESALSSGTIEDDSTAEMDHSEDSIEVMQGEVIGDEIVLSDTERQLTEPEARLITDSIRSTSEVLYSMVAKAYAGKAWVSLGYADFKEYVTYEFNISVSTAYSLINQNRVIEQLEAATPQGTKISINQTSAKKLKKVMDELLPEIQSATSSMGPREASEYVENRVDEVKSNQRHGAPPEGYEESGEEYGSSAAQGYGGGQGGGSGGGGFSGGDSDFDDLPGTFEDGERSSEPRSEEFDDIDLSDLDLSDLDLSDVAMPGESDGDDNSEESVYRFYSTLTTFDDLPHDIDKMVNSISDDQIEKIDHSYKSALKWLTEFGNKWEERTKNFDFSSDKPIESEAEQENSYEFSDNGDEFEDEDFENITDSNTEE